MSDGTLSQAIIKDSSDVKISGGYQFVAAPGSSVTINEASPAAALDKLSAVAAHTALYDSSERSPMPRCHRNTRTSYLDAFERWMLGLGGEDDSARLRWLTGGAGAGKSAIMQSIVERCVPYGAVLGAFFFSRTDSSRNYANVLIPTLAYQLARAFPTAMTVLEPIILRDPLIFKASLQTQAHGLLVQPLLYLIEMGVIDINSPLRRVFVIDGLDECSDPEKQALIVHTVAAILQDNLLPVCFLIASRPEIAISRAFERENRVHLILSITLEDNNEASSDIRQFIEDSFLDIHDMHPLRAHIPPNWPHPDSIKRLVWKSSGHFVYAATAMKFISSSEEHPARALKVVEGLVSSRTENPFSELDALYMHILTSAKHHGQVLGILRHCVLTKKHNSVRAICFMYPDFSPADVELFLLDVQALVSLSPNHKAEMRIVLKHASLHDFLTDVDRSGTLFLQEEVYIASFLSQYFQLLDNGPQPHEPPFFITEVFVLELHDAIRYSQDIGLLHSLISGHSPRDIWNFIIKERLANKDHDLRRHNACEILRTDATDCMCEYMRTIRNSVANYDNTLYIDQFKMFIRVLMDEFNNQVQTKPQYRILPALMFSSGSVSCLTDVAPSLLWYFLSSEHNIDNWYHGYFLHITAREAWRDGRPELHPKSYEALRTLPYAHMSWGSDLAYILRLVLQYLQGYTWTPEFILPNVHKQWLNRMKPMKHISQGSPKLSSSLPFNSYFYRYAYLARYRSAIYRDTMYTDTDSLHAKLKPYGLTLDRVEKLVDRRRQCFVLLMAVISYLHKCDCTSELAALARKSLPKAALWFPWLMKRARVKMDAYVRRWEESLDGLLERAQLLNINDMD